MKGRKRTQPGYHASRGWFYKPIQKVITKWDKVFGREFTHNAFQQLQREIENGCGQFEIEVHDANHIKLLYELVVSLEGLYDRENTHGWVVRFWPQCNYDAGKATPLSYAQIKQRILDHGGPTFEVHALKQAAMRLKLTSSGSRLDLKKFSQKELKRLSREKINAPSQVELDELSVFNPDISPRKSRRPIRN